MAFKDFGDSVLKLMSNLDHVGIMLAIHADGFLPEDKGGSVNLHKDGRIGISYPVGEKLKEAFKEAHDVLTQVTLKAGAQKAMTFHFDPIVMRSDSERSKLQKAKYGALEHAIFSAHQMGGCAMGQTQKRRWWILILGTANLIIFLSRMGLFSFVFRREPESNHLYVGSLSVGKSIGCNIITQHSRRA